MEPKIDLEPGTFQFNVVVAKVDKEKRQVTGIVTAEVIDKQGDIVDYETAKKFFTDEDLWPGNIREMHQPKAVGSRVSTDCDDVNKTITLTARVSKGAPDTWEKVLDGTLKMYSIGGSGDRKVEKVADNKTAKRLFLKGLAEVSLVDNGANPLAKFEIVKSMDGHLVDAQPIDTKSFAGVDGQSLLIAEPKDVRSAVKSLGRTAQESISAVKSNIVNIAYDLGTDFVAQLPEPWKKPEDRTVKTEAAGDVVKSGPEPYDIDSALNAISFVNRLMAQEYWDARYSTAATEVQIQQIGMLKSACDALLAFLQSEYEEQFTAPPETTSTPFDLSSILGEETAVAMTTAACNVLKSGARHSKGDMEMVQKMHDTSVSLGAACSVEKVDTPVPAAVAAATSAAKLDTPEPPAAAPVVVPESEPVTKLAGDLETAKTQLKEQGDLITKLNEKLEQVLNTPRPGGPVAREVPGLAVHKALGGEAPATSKNEMTPEVLVAAFQHLAKEGDDTVRKAAAVEIAKIQNKTGLGRIDLGLR